MPIEAINDAPTIYHATLFFLLFIVTMYFEGKTIAKVTEIVLKEGVYPNIGFIVKSLMFCALLLSSVSHSYISDDVIITVGFITALVPVLLFTREQAMERLSKTG